VGKRINNKKMMATNKKLREFIALVSDSLQRADNNMPLPDEGEKRRPKPVIQSNIVDVYSDDDIDDDEPPYVPPKDKEEANDIDQPNANTRLKPAKQKQSQSNATVFEQEISDGEVLRIHCINNRGVKLHQHTVSRHASELKKQGILVFAIIESRHNKSQLGSLQLDEYLLFSAEMPPETIERNFLAKECPDAQRTINTLIEQNIDPKDDEQGKAAMLAINQAKNRLATSTAKHAQHGILLYMHKSICAGARLVPSNNNDGSSSNHLHVCVPFILW
jgi:hypothetical protein